MIVIKSKKARGIIRYLLPLIFVILVTVSAFYIDSERGALYISLVVCLLSLLLFASGYEKKKIGTRRMIISAVMITLSVVGRFIPVFKPVTALTVITALYLGGEAGFLVGSMSALISDFYFVIGPWTPFQMLAWGMIGLISGVISKKLKDNFALLICWGALTGVFFSLVMDVWNTIWTAGSFDAAYYRASIISALPYTLLYAVSNVIFLLLCAKPIGQKLERIKKKYGV